MAQETKVWTFHGGEAATRSSKFFGKNCIAIAWVPSRDLSKAPPDRLSFRELVARAWPERAAKGTNSVAAASGQLFRFVHEMQVGDLIALPLKREDTIYLGTVTGPYRYDRAGLPESPHVRPVRWLGPLPKSRFSPAAIREMGSALTVFLIKKYASEFLAAAESL